MSSFGLTLLPGTNSASREDTSKHPYNCLEQATFSVYGQLFGRWVTLVVQDTEHPWKAWSVKISATSSFAWADRTLVALFV